LNAKVNDSGIGADHSANPNVEGGGVTVVRPGSEEGVMPQDVLGVQAISR
jgi:hypothetical protein